MTTNPVLELHLVLLDLNAVKNYEALDIKPTKVKLYTAGKIWICGRSQSIVLLVITIISIPEETYYRYSGLLLFQLI